MVHKQKNRRALPDIPDLSTFQGKCEALSGASFPANVDIPLPIVSGYFPLCSQDHGNTFHPVSANAINKILQNSQLDSATGVDQISYHVIRTLTEQRPQLLTDIYYNLLKHDMFLTG